uniref:NADH dehydrogenase subunit 5 n=1 Tax=Micronephthys minuta TaxID=1037237 RepID=UPI0030DE72B9
MFLYMSSLNSSRMLSALMLITLPSALWLIMSNKTVLLEWEITSIQSSHIYMMFIMDPMGMLFSSTVLFISANVLYFSSSYMKDEKFLKRFIHLVLLFVASMNLLIFIPHMMMILLGWDGLGLVSFLLVIYYQNSKSLAAGMITALMNRVGDVLILLSIAWTLNQGHWSIMNMWDSSFSTLITMCIMVAAMTKSAQIPFSSWLPAAMAAPTPVSALVHSSTLVTAGVFLTIRFYPFLHKTYWFNSALLIIATMTMLMAGISAIAECDMKKIIALSTLSQLGVMMMSLGLNLPALAFFHLLTHALFKALLFLCAGSMIHLHHHSQDLRFMGNLTRQMPLTSSCLIIANMALCGSPFLAGFYSKDMIIESTLFFNNNFIIINMLMLATALTAAYSIRMMVTVIWGPLSSLPYQYTSDEDSYMTTPMINLTTGAILAGASMNWFMFQPIMEPFLSLQLKLAALVATMLGVMMGLTINTKNNPGQAIMMSFPWVHAVSAFMWFLVPTAAQGVIKLPMGLAHKLLSTIDQGWVEMYGAQGAYKMSTSLSSTKEKWLSSITTTHLSLSFIFLVVLIFSIS